MNRRTAIGKMAEDTAAHYLQCVGLTIAARNVRLRGGEIDLVCRDGDRWVFVEVKCRQARWGDAPGAAVSAQKQRRIVRLAQHYLKSNRLGQPRCRFDVVAVTVRDDGASDVRHIPSAFDASGV